MIMILIIMRLFTCVINRSAFCLLHGPAFLIKPDHGDDDNYNSDNSNDDNNTNDDDALSVLSRQLWWRITIPPTSFRASNGWWQALLAKVSDGKNRGNNCCRFKMTWYHGWAMSPICPGWASLGNVLVTVRLSLRKNRGNNCCWLAITFVSTYTHLHWNAHTVKQLLRWFRRELIQQIVNTNVSHEVANHLGDRHALASVFCHPATS